jgi:predicted TIM-barrel fold metal-dependent hydrolase
MATAPVVKQRLISMDSHVHFTDEWVKARLSAPLQTVWDNASAAQAKYDAEVHRGGQPNLQVEDFVDMEAAMDPGHFEPNAKLAAMDRDGVEAEVIFPEVSGANLCTPKLMGSDWSAALAGYNDAMADFAAVDPNRLLVAYQMPLFDIDFAVSEVFRVAKRGARAVQLPSFPSEFGVPAYHDKSYDKLWAALSETKITIFNHLSLRDSGWEVFRRDPTPQKGIFTALPPMQLAETIAFWILTGTLERFPNLKVIFVEPGLGWLPWFVNFVLDGRMHQHYEFPNVKLLPSEYFKRQCGATFMYEPQGLADCYKAFGPDCLYWSTDFPHPATCWPNSQKQVISQFAEAGIPDADRDKIIRDNALNTFGLK